MLADKPIAVFSGNVNANVNNFEQPQISGHLVEQLIPYSLWGSTHLVVPFPDREYVFLKV